MERLQMWCLLLLTAGVACQTSEDSKKVSLNDLKYELETHSEDSSNRNKALMDTVKAIQKENTAIREKVNLLENSIIDGVKQMLGSLRLELRNSFQSLTSACNESRNKENNKSYVDCSNIQRMHKEHPLLILGTGIYRVSPLPAYYKFAKSNCEGLGMRLAILESKAKLDALRINLKTDKSKENSSLWVAATDSGDVAGQYKWANGLPVLKSLLNTGSSNGSCVSLAATQGELSGGPCSTNKKYSLCEADQMYASCFSDN